LTPSDAVSQWRAGLIYVTRDRMMSTTVTVIAPRLNCYRNLTHGVSSPKTLRNFSAPPRYSYCTATNASKSPDRIFAAAEDILGCRAGQERPVWRRVLARAPAFIACAQVAFKCLTTATDYPVNDGSFRNLKVIMPMGRVISAERPYPMRVWMTYPMTVIDTIFKAFARAIPDRTIAGHHADLVFPNIHGISPVDGKLFIVGIGPLGGGWGAKRDEDGVSVTVCINDGDTHNSPSEQLEAKYPVLVERYSIREDSSGAGRTRGGLGAEMVVQALSPFSLTTRIDRMHCKPWGLDGGGEAAGNSIGIRRNGRWEKDLPNAKIFNVRLNRGDAYMMQSGGGGGFGDPMERDPELVAEDVREGYVSPTVAHNVYGVVLTTSGDVDVYATRLRRAAKAPVRVEEEAFEVNPG
jgi:N-methylhydantoinase B